MMVLQGSKVLRITPGERDVLAMYATAGCRACQKTGLRQSHFNNDEWLCDCVIRTLDIDLTVRDHDLTYFAEQH